MSIILPAQQNLKLEGVGISERRPGILVKGQTVCVIIMDGGRIVVRAGKISQINVQKIVVDRLEPLRSSDECNQSQMQAREFPLESPYVVTVDEAISLRDRAAAMEWFRGFEQECDADSISAVLSEISVFPGKNQ